jgi:glycosyltransferase involved in cell wall biosynthesis
MRIAAVVPHLLQFGGVRRFLELGNVFIDRGLNYTLFASDSSFNDWFNYRGELATWNQITGDVLLIADPPSFKVLRRVECPVYIWVIAGGQYLPVYEKFKDKYPFLLNNRIFLKNFPSGRLVEGGVNVKHFHSIRRPSVGYYAGRGWTKGETEIVNAIGDLDNIRLVPLRGLSDHELPAYYRGLDYFVTWEQRAGWSNTAAEALACGVPVVTNGRNCEPFANRVIRVSDLRAFFATPMAEFSWESTADKLECIWKHDGVL